MKWTFDAIVDHGVLRPIEPQPLSDRRRVRVTVEEDTTDDAESASSKINGTANGLNRPDRVPGSAKGIITYIAPDFDAPLEDFREYME